MNIFSTGNERQLTADYGMYLTLTADVERKHLPLVKIVHLDLTENTGDWKEINEEEAQLIRQAKGHTAAAIDMTRYEQQMKLATMAVNNMSLTDEQALEVKELFPSWDTLWGQTLPVGFKLLYNGNLYKVLQEHTAQEQWKPGTETASLYALVGTNVPEEGEHAGTKEDPIPYEQMMLIEKDKYYIQGGKIYVGIQTTITGYPYDLKDMASVVQEVSIESKESFNL